MPTPSGPYAKTAWVDSTTAINQTRMNNLETQSQVALASLNPDLVGAGFILSGCAASRHNSYSATVLADAPTRYYRLDESSVLTPLLDLGSAMRSLLYNGSPTLGVAGLLTGDSDTCVTFAAASSQYASGVTTEGLPTGSGNATLEAWIKVAGAPAITQVILEVGDVAVANHRLCLQLTAALTLQLTNGTVTITSAAITTGAPHHVVGTWDGTSLRLYVDGILAAGPTAATMSWSYTGNSMCIATASGATPGNWFSGQIDEVAVYTTALSLTRVTAHYTNGTTATTQVDIASGSAYLVVSDGTLARCTVTGTTETTATISSTYNLYLQPDGTFYWNTLNTPAANSLYIATVTTDGSGNAVKVTDKRTLGISQFSGADGGLPLAGGALSALTSVGFTIPAPWAFGTPLRITRAGTYLVTMCLQSDCVGAATMTINLNKNGAVVNGSGFAEQDVPAGKFFTITWQQVISCAANDYLCIQWASLSGATTSSGGGMLALTALRIGS